MTGTDERLIVSRGDETVTVVRTGSTGRPPTAAEILSATDGVLDTTQLGDVSDSLAASTGAAMLWNGAASQWEPVDDLDLAAPVRAGGTATGGLIRPSGLHVLWDYVHSVPVSDVTIGTAYNAEWYMTVGADGAPFGPAITSGWFGPRGVFNLEGLHRWSTNGNVFSFTPIGFLDAMCHANTAGQARTIHPGWGYVNAQIITADAATVTLGGNDTSEGAAGFVDTQVFWTVDSGTMDGTTNDYELISFLSGGGVAGNSHLHRRIGFRVAEVGVGHKTNAWLEREWDGVLRVPASNFTFNDPNGTLIGDVDSSVDSDLDENIGLYIVRLKTGTKNVGIWNRSTTVEAPLAVTIDAAGDTITETLAAGDRLTATTVHLANTTGAAITLTSTPTIPDGTDGQRLSLVNVGADPVVLQAESVLTGSGISTGRTLASGTSVTLSWVESLGLWVELDRPGDTLALKGVAGAVASFWVTGEALQRVTVGTAPLFGLHGLFAGDGTANDTYLTRASAGVWSLGTAGGLTGVGKGIGFTEQTAPSSPAANTITLYAADAAGTTVLQTKDSAGTVTTLGGGGVSSVSGTAPIVSSGGATPAISITAASTTASGSVELATTAETQTGTDTVRAITPAGGAATYQPLDSDLTAIAALSTTAYGRALLALADAAAGRTALGAATVPATKWISHGVFFAVTGSVAASNHGSTKTPGWLFDQTATEQIATVCSVPDDWATFSADLWWSNPGSGSGDVRWVVTLTWLQDGDDADAVSGSPSTTLATAPGQDVIKVTQAVPSATVAAGKTLKVFLFRDSAHASDTLGNDASFTGLRLVRLT